MAEICNEEYLFMSINKKRIIVLALLLCLALYANCAFAKELSIGDFMGPPVGKKYIYENSKGRIKELEGMKYLETNVIEVDEIRYFDSKILPPGIPRENKLTYRLRISKDKIEREFRGKSQVVLKYNGTKESGVWEIEGIKLEPGNKSVPMITKCKIKEIEQKIMFGDERFLLTTECITKNADIEFVVLDKYAEGIGLIETSSSLNDGQSKIDLDNTYFLKHIEDITPAKK